MRSMLLARNGALASLCYTICKEWAHPMDTKNYINIDASKRNSHVYRYIKLHRLYQLFAERENVLVLPSMWEDPFENFILKAKTRDRDGTVHEFGFRDRLYGQCWTTESRSDAMWRIYSQKADHGRFDGVRVRTTVKRLAESLTARMTFGDVKHAFIGRVEYLPDTKLFESASKIFAKGLTPRTVASTLLVKRNAFRHEKEVRLVYRKLFGDPAQEGKLRYKVDPHDLVDQIILDPRVNPAEIKAMKNEIAARTGFKGEVKWSLLYKAPKSFIFQVSI
ncbi:hypothetical protein [Mesorhizobium sp.]|uniref:DUF2971 domain-containing protein n=1 Tax=Mesorhizobium sp. TaxID=1871066 RepID=UPI0025BC0386|nr:hypothetical protein [Mesorhizobium sp.]